MFIIIYVTKLAFHRSYKSHAVLANTFLSPTTPLPYPVLSKMAEQSAVEKTVMNKRLPTKVRSICHTEIILATVNLIELCLPVT